VPFARRSNRQAEVPHSGVARTSLDEKNCCGHGRRSTAQSSRTECEIACLGEKLMAIEIHFEKRIINNNVIRQTDAKSHRDYIVITALASMFLFGLFAYGWQHYQCIQYGYRIEEAQKKKAQLAEIG